MLLAITGGDGAVGRALQKALALDSVPFRALVSSEPPVRYSRTGEVIIGDETDSDSVARLLDGASALIHLGRVNVSSDDDFCQEELSGQATLIPAARERGLEVHFLSSSEVFSPPDDPSAAPLSEDVPVQPVSSLGIAKVAWEQTLRIWSENHDLHYVIYRAPVVVAEYLSYGSRAARYLREGFRSGEIHPRAQDHDRWGLSYIHAEDAARTIMQTVGRGTSYGQVYHLSADMWISESDLAEMSYRVLRDFMIPCEWKHPPGDVPGGLLNTVWLDNAKAKTDLGLDVSNSVERLMQKLRLWVDDFGSTARLPVSS